MMQDMFAGACAGGMWLAGSVGLLVILVLILAAAALIKYLLAGRNRTGVHG